MTSAPMPRSVVVLHETIGPHARADEADTLVQVDEVAAALAALGWSVATLATGLDLGATRAELESRRPDLVFNLVESLAGDGRLITLIPQLLAASGFPFTGCGAGTIHLSSDKVLAKRWMSLNGIPTPALLGAAGGVDTGSCWIVKSVWEHASLGLDAGSVVTDAAAAHARIAECRARHGGDWFAEHYVDGREYNISVLETDGRVRILPIAEMRFVGFAPAQPRIVGYAAKWDPAAPEYDATQRSFAPLPENERSALTSVVDDCWRAFGLRGYARVDIRVDEHGQPWVLEVNANPCLSADAGFAAAALEAGISYPRLIESIAAAAAPEAAREYRHAG